jgi:oxygen-dependent protoporphyrinogen oxidase
LCALDDAGIEQLVKTELGELLGVGGKPVFMRILRYPRAMPQYHLGHLDRVAAIEARIDSLPGLALAGNAYRGVGIPDCVHSGECAAERVVGYS